MPQRLTTHSQRVRATSHKPADRRLSPSKRGYGKRHQRWRQLVLARDNWICQEHKRRGEIVAGSHADHIVPLHRGGAPFDLANGQTLCSTCHARKTATEDGGFGRQPREMKRAGGGS